MISSAAGRTPLAMMAAEAAPAATTDGRWAPIVAVVPAGTGSSRTVAPTTTPSVPSLPTIRPTRSSPVTPFTVRWPSRRSVPSASTTSSPSTASRVTPYFTHMRPPAPVAIVPPMVAHARLAGSGA